MLHVCSKCQVVAFSPPILTLHPEMIILLMELQCKTVGHLCTNLFFVKNDL